MIKENNQQIPICRGVLLERICHGSPWLFLWLQQVNFCDSPVRVLRLEKISKPDLWKFEKSNEKSRRGS